MKKNKLAFFFMFALLAAVGIKLSTDVYRHDYTSGDRAPASITVKSCLEGIANAINPHHYMVDWHSRPLEKLGVKIVKSAGTKRGQFSIWLPSAKRVEVITELDDWKEGVHKLEKDPETGIWRGEIAGFDNQVKYKYRILDVNGQVQYRMDPNSDYIFREGFDLTWHGVSWDHSKFRWTDSGFKANPKMRIIEVHPGTIVPGNKYANYREIGDYIVDSLKGKVTHVSLMPIIQHNVMESWGYQPGGLFSVNYRHGNPDDLKYMINKLHDNDIGVIMDFVYGHASKDWDTGLANIDGAPTYFKDGVMGHHPDWDTKLYDFSKEEVSNFLLTNAEFWIRNYHIDGARLDGVSSMLYLDFGRQGGEWIPHPRDGGNFNHEAQTFLRDFNKMVHKIKPGFVSIAEESAGYWGDTRALVDGGLGFDYMWGMWGMHNSRSFIKQHPMDRNLFELYDPLLKDPQNTINYINSHDEMASGKTGFIEMISNVSETQRYDMARNITAHLYLNMPGSPMIFQGDQFASRGWWNEHTQPGYHYQNAHEHSAFENFVKKLGEFYDEEPAFDSRSNSSAKLLIIDNEKKVGVLQRMGKTEDDSLIIVQNYLFNDVDSYRVPVPSLGTWEVIFNSDATEFGGRGILVSVKEAMPQNVYDTPNSVEMNIPAYSTIVLKKVR